MAERKTTKTTDYLTKFEFARLVGLRVLQLDTEGTCIECPRAVALREILRGESEAVVRRKLPDGSVEDRPVRGLRLTATLRRTCEEGLW